MVFSGSSSSVSRRSSMDSTTQERMQVFVKDLRGDTTALSVSSTTPIASLLPPSTGSVLATPAVDASATEPTPLTTRLTYHGRPLSLSPTSTLASNSIPTHSLLSLSAPLLGGASTSTSAPTSASPPKSTGTPSRKPRCGHKDCKTFAQPIVGDCGFCQGHFCGKHRLLESHSCTGLEDCKKESRDRNAETLRSERTGMVRGV